MLQGQVARRPQGARKVLQEQEQEQEGGNEEQQEVLSLPGHHHVWKQEVYNLLELSQ